MKPSASGVSAVPDRAPPVRRDDWKRLARCRSMDGALFFGRPDKYGVDRHDPAELDEAVDACARCPVREECLDAALSGGADVFGVWGGTTKADREKLTRHIHRVKCPLCASKVLRTYAALQVCGGCGHSWPTMKPAQAADVRAA